MQKKYTLTELILIAIEHYQMPADKNRQGKTVVLEAYRKKFIDYLSSTTGRNGKTLLENAIDPHYKPTNKKEKYFFTEQQVSEIIYADPIYDYCISNSTNEKIKNSPPRKELAEKAEKAKAEWYNFLSENKLPYEPYIGVSVSPDDISEAQSQVMVKALFELFFTPISAEFGTDMTIASLYGGDTSTPQSIESAERFSDPKNYYSPNIENDVLDKVLDKLADKIAERIKGNTFFGHR